LRLCIKKGGRTSFNHLSNLLYENRLIYPLEPLDDDDLTDPDDLLLEVLMLLEDLEVEVRGDLIDLLLLLEVL